MSAASAACVCRVCAADTGHRHFTVREMYFGSREPFPYFECGVCGTLQIRQVPEDLGRHYPPDYYSFVPRRKAAPSALATALRRLRADAWIGNRKSTRIGRFLARLSRREPDYVSWLFGLPVDTGSRVADVGCGGGELLRKLHREGFRHLVGLDPFIVEDRDLGGGVRVLRRSLENDDGIYDLIMMHHSFEHMADPRATMSQIAARLAPGGMALLRLPVAGTYAWRTYGENWFQLDAPRHLVIPTVGAMRLLAASAGMEVAAVFFDSKPQQLLASEGYRRDVPLVEQGRTLSWTDEDLALARSSAEELNGREDGDQAGFLLRLRREETDGRVSP